MLERNEAGDGPGAPTAVTTLMRRYKRTATAALLFLAALITYVLNRNKNSPAIDELLLALTAAMAVHLLDRLWLHVETEEAFDRLRRQIVNKVEAVTQKSIQTVAAVGKAGLVRVYENRESAAEDIGQSLTSQRVTKIRLSGISLNDFVLGNERHPLKRAWKVLKSNVENGVGQSRKLDIRVLIIDPACSGAQLRSKAEERGLQSFIGRLRAQVESVIAEMLVLKGGAKASNVSIECKLYRLPPMLFLCWTDYDSYVQQYYFWSSRDDEEKSFPVFRFQSTKNESIHADLEKHIDWIWDHASVSCAAWKDEATVGVDQGIVQSGIRNLFISPADGLNRMVYLLSVAKHRVSIQGNSLHSFFNARSNSSALYVEIKKLLIADLVRIQILILNPESEQARFRAFREQSLKSEELKRREYFANEAEHKSSLLSKETSEAISALESLVKDVSRVKGLGWEPKLTVALYDSAPYCFLFRADQTVLVEQYHYGKLPEAADRDRLGKEVPLIEYSANPDDLFSLTGKTPFELFESHFDFALKESEPLPVERWAGMGNASTARA